MRRLSRKYQKLAADGQLWKAHYYNRFVRPRASRLPGLKDFGASHETLYFASKASRWLDEDHLVKSGGTTNWKRRYRLRHNWSQGSCAVNEIPVHQRESIPPVLVQMSEGVIYMADDCLRAWAAQDSCEGIAQVPLTPSKTPRPPTSLAIDSQSAGKDSSKVVIGFEDGSFDVYVLKKLERKFEHLYTHGPSFSGVVTAGATCWPYVVTMTATQRLSLYRFSGDELPDSIQGPPRLLHSLVSHTVWPPLTVSLRPSPSAIFVCVAYALPTYLSGWTVGIQEVKVALDGAVVQSRTASAIDQHYRPLAFSTRPTMHHLTPPVPGPAHTPALELKHIHTKPTSLSYTHPYLLVSHPDNTLTLYLVASTSESLSISAGSRLWGHTSAVSGAHVGGRGKAVSISRKGDELRVWELEGGFESSAARKRLASSDLSVQIRPGSTPSGRKVRPPRTGLDLVSSCSTSLVDDDHDDGDCDSEVTLTRGWIGFDDEKVVILKEQSRGKQSLVVYDFT